MKYLLARLCVSVRRSNQNYLKPPKRALGVCDDKWSPKWRARIFDTDNLKKKEIQTK